MTDLARLYEKRLSTTGLEKRHRVWRSLCRYFFDELIGEGKTVLDLACGYGEFINNIAAARKFAVDLNPDAATHLDADVAYANTAANDLSHLTDGSIDVVFTSNFLEHLPSKAACDAVFREVKRVLRPGGRFVIMGPNIRYAYREYWDFYDHYLPLSHHSLAEGLVLSGLKPTRIAPRFLPYTMRGKAPTNTALVWLYLRVPVLWKIFGKQFLVVAER